jgi:hypothetical protein
MTRPAYGLSLYKQTLFTLFTLSFNNKTRPKQSLAITTKLNHNQTQTSTTMFTTYILLSFLATLIMAATTTVYVCSLDYYTGDCNTLTVPLGQCYTPNPDRDIFPWGLSSIRLDNGIECTLYSQDSCSGLSVGPQSSVPALEEVANFNLVGNSWDNNVQSFDCFDALKESAAGDLKDVGNGFVAPGRGKRT